MLSLIVLFWIALIVLSDSFKLVDCVQLANRLIDELELDRHPIDSVIEIDGEFVWLIIERVFNTSLLPKWQSLDCVNETEEFQFILQTLEQIFDLNLTGVNPAYLTMRKPEIVYLVLNALWMANDYVKSKKIDLSETTNSAELNDLKIQLTPSDSSEVLSMSSDLSNLSIDSSGSSDKPQSNKKEIGSNEAKNEDRNEDRKSETSSLITSSNEEDSLKLSEKSTQESIQKLSKRLPKKSKPRKELDSRTRKEFTDDELANELKELKDGKHLIQS